MSPKTVVSMKQARASEKETRLITIHDFAARLSISVWTARGMAYSGRIDSVKIGRLLQVPETEVQRVISEGFRPRLPKTARPRCCGDTNAATQNVSIETSNR